VWNREVEVARYALTRRLVPVLRHHLVVHLQPTGMLCEAAESKLGAAPLDQDSLRDTVTRIGDHARALVELRWIFLAFKPSRSIKCHKKTKAATAAKTNLSRTPAPTAENTLTKVRLTASPALPQARKTKAIR